MRTFSKILCAVTAMLVVCSLAQAQNNVTLRYKMKKGEKYIYRKTQSTKQSQTVLKKKIETDIKQTEIGVWTLEKREADGNLRISMENKRLNSKVTIGPLGTYVFDSKKKEHDKGSMLGASLTPIYERLSGAMFRVTITPRGEIKKLDGFKELLGDVIKDNPLGAQFVGGDAETAKIGYGEYFPTLSKKPIAEGDQWETPLEFNLPKLGKVTGKKIYTYAGPGKVGKLKTAKITIATELAFDLNIKTDGQVVKGNLSITDSSGVIHFDVQRGIVVSMNVNYTLSGILNVSVNGQDLQVGTDQVQRFTLDLLEKMPE